MKEITSDLNNSEVKSLHKVEVSLHVNIENTGIETAFSDGTKTHSQEKGLAKEMRSAKAVTNETVFCGDAEKEMIKLWEDKIMLLEERKTATFIKEYSNNMVVFAKFAVNGRKVP